MDGYPPDELQKTFQEKQLHIYIDTKGRLSKTFLQQFQTIVKLRERFNGT